MEAPLPPELIESFRRLNVEAARELIGTPWHHQGRIPGIGIDCIGMLVCTAIRRGIPHMDSTDYHRKPTNGSLIRGLERSGLVRGGPEIYLSSVLAFWIRDKENPQHVGIRTDRGIIHTWESVGKCVEHGFSDFWAERVHSVWEFPWQH